MVDAQMTRLDKQIQQLPPELQREVEIFVRDLAERGGKRPRKKLRLDWKGGLKDLRSQYTSVELQHKALDWWGD